VFRFVACRLSRASVCVCARAECGVCALASGMSRCVLVVVAHVCELVTDLRFNIYITYTFEW
jgi:hypothetical protein